MKVAISMLTIALLVGCANTSEPSAEQRQSTPAPASEPAAMTAKAITASATGTVEAIDVSAKAVTIAHGPIAAVKWPAMTMTFSAPTVDLSSIKTGDHVNFKLAVNGMHGEVVEIARR